MNEIEVLLIVRQRTEDGYIEWNLENPLPWAMLSTGIKRQIRKLLGNSNDSP